MTSETFSAQDLHINELYTRTRHHSARLSALEAAYQQLSLQVNTQNQTDSKELVDLRTEIEELLQKNNELKEDNEGWREANEKLASANRRIEGRSTSRWKEIQDLRVDNIRLKDENNKLSASIKRIVDSSLKTDDENRDLKTDNHALRKELKHYVNLESENTRLCELLNAGQIVRALAVAAGESK